MPPWNGPPAAIVEVVVRWGGREDRVWGLIDSGADSTHVPRDIATSLRLRPVRELEVRGMENRTAIRRVYVADVEFEGLVFRTVEVVESRLDFVLIGRDLPNELEALLNGPAQEFSLRNAL